MKSMLKFTPILLGLAVYFNQLIIANNGVLSRWKLGGFGMFSNIDDAKIIISATTHDDKNVLINLEVSKFNDSFKVLNEQFTDKIEIYPKTEYLKILALEIYQRKLIVQENVYSVLSDEEVLLDVSGNGVILPYDKRETRKFFGYNQFKNIKVSLWRRDYSQETNKVSYYRVNEVVVNNDKY